MTDKSPDPVRIPLGRDVSLVFRDSRSGPWDYASSHIQKGLILSYRNRELVEEGVGFGTPILKFGCETVFPGKAHLSTRHNDASSIVEVDYELNVIQRLVMNGKTLSSPAVYEIQEFFSRLHRNYLLLRSPGAWFCNNLLRVCAIKERFENTVSAGTARVVYTIPDGNDTVHISVDLTGLKKDSCTEVTVANEQGATCFDQYLDSNGLALAGKAVGTWDETFAKKASFVDSLDGITFTLRNVKGARIFRGRELLEGRLAWAGLNYVLSQNTNNLTYGIKIGSIK